MIKIGMYITAAAAALSLTLGSPVLCWAEEEAVSAVIEVPVREKPVEEVPEEEVVASEVISVLTKEEKAIAAAQKAEREEAERIAEETRAREEAEAAAKAEEEAHSEATLRQNLVNYAMQFVGKPYRDGGNDPHTGADCSGFVKYVMQYGAGISMNRSSAAQSGQGHTVSADEMQPGDLIFYGNGSRVNHVAMYIGSGRIVHASTERSGIKTSVWNYRSPIKIISMFG
ncbi:MAG: C40 family peptidase [Clostridiales bacterium]|nr:C40 family peptidase [Clostridiales bacterium]